MKMKKHSFILWAALSMTSVFTACTDEDSLVTEQTESKHVTIRATIDGDLGSRVALTDDADNRVVKVDWAEGDDFKITVNNKDYTFVYNPSTGEFEYDNNQNETFPETFASAGTVTATYPATAPEEYDNQSGTLEGAAAFLTMTATLEVTEGRSTENLALNFKHNNSIVKLTLKNDAFKGNSVTGVALKSGSDAVATASGDFMGDANGNIVAYFAVEPKAMTGISIHAVCEYKNYTATLSDNNLETGKLYNVTKAMTQVTPMGEKNAATAVKGDFAMKDGSFISKDATSLTNEQIANIAGIVFWTVNDEGPSTLVGTDVADKVMQSAFPKCTHGLIVSLTDVSTSCVWQNPYESIYDKFQKTDNFNPENKTNYVAIESGTGASDNINKILGYNNTKVLEAYNAYCKANNRTNYLVKPIEALATWKASNFDIIGTTGWFLPSAKELHMLCYKDVDGNVLNTYNSAYTDTKVIVNASLNKVNGNQFGNNYYWSSSERAGDERNAFRVHFSNADVDGYYKYNPRHVRAVCAY